MTRRTVIWCVAVSLIGCAEVPSASKALPTSQPVATSGYFRAVSLDGQPLPARASQSTIETGDLVLLDDGNVRAQMVGGTFDFGQPVLEGSWKVDGATLTVTSTDGASQRTGTIAGDSIVLIMPMQQETQSGPSIREQPVVFRRMMPDAVSIQKGVYVLRDNATHADTITFHDGVFYRRKESVSGNTREFWGTYRGNGSSIVLLSSMRALADGVALAVDTLDVSKDALQRAGSSVRYTRQ